MQEAGMVPAKKAHTNIETGETAKEERKQQKESEGNRMKMMKKISALVLALVMVLGICGTVIADSTAVLNDNAATTADIETVRFVKEITVYNPDTVVVIEPTASYTYTVTAGTGGKTIQDANNHSANTKAGVVSNIKMASQTDTTLSERNSVMLTYTPNASNTMNASSNGTANTKWVDIDFSAVNFGGAGVYRYKITESDYTYGSNGVVAGDDTSHVRYLDVYVKDAETQSSTLDQPSDWVIYGYAMFPEDENIDDSTTATGVRQTRKTTGFVSHVDGTDQTTDAVKADQYFTFNLTIKKVVNKDAYTKSTHHEFPFTVTLSNPTVTAKTLPVMETDGNAHQNALAGAGIVIGNSAADPSTATVWNPTISDNATVTYTGIPAGTTIKIKEKNDVTGTTYNVGTTGADTNVTNESIFTDEFSSEAVISTSTGTAGTKVTANKIVVFTNNLEEISPTGYVTRYAPYALLLIGGIVLLVVAMKHKKHTDEE